MIIPTFANVQYTDKDGYLTSAMQMYNDQLNNTLRNGLSDNGWTLPIVTAAELATLEALPTIDKMPNGTLWVVIDADPPTAVPELVVKLDDGTGLGVSALYKLTKSAYP
jgi:hypothetical protein